MMRALIVVAAAALTLAACGQQQQTTDESGTSAPVEDTLAGEEELVPLPEVETPLLQTPSSEFVALEPSELGVFGAPTIQEAIDPLVGSPEAQQEGASVSLSIRESGDTATADIVQSNIPDDSVSAGHVRIEFRREPEGWFPTNAYRRSLCRRGESAGQWTSGLCP
jgi:hypothetical protein